MLTAIICVVIGIVGTHVFYVAREYREWKKEITSRNNWLAEEAKRRGTDTWSI